MKNFYLNAHKATKNGIDGVYIVIFVFLLSILVNIIPSVQEKFFSLASPIHIIAEKTHDSLIDFFSNVFSFKYTYSRILELQEENIKLKSMDENCRLVREDLQKMKDSKNIVSKNNLQLEANVLLPTDRTVLGKIFVNVGRDDGVAVGDTIVVGNFFVGIISDVESHRSVVKLPTNKSAVFRVLIVPKDSTHVETSSNGEGIISGMLDRIIIRDVVMKRPLEVGDKIFVKDEKVNGIFFVGTVSSVSSDPSNPVKQGVVEPLGSYNELNKVYILLQ